MVFSKLSISFFNHTSEHGKNYSFPDLDPALAYSLSLHLVSNLNDTWLTLPDTTGSLPIVRNESRPPLVGKTGQKAGPWPVWATPP